MSDAHILCIASGAVAGQMKYYFYAQVSLQQMWRVVFFFFLRFADHPLQDTYEGIYLIEVFVGSSDRELKATFKADSAARVPRFVEVFKETLRPLCRH
jgi:hypothetical protein